MQLLPNSGARLRIIIPNNSNPMNYPSNFSKDLTFGNDSRKTDLQNIKSIRPQGDEEFLHVVFSDTNFPNVLIQGAPQRFASISMIDHLINNNILVEDSFPVGNFVVDLHVFSGAGHCSAKFRIRVGNIDFRDLHMRRLSRLERLKLRFGIFPRT